MAAKKKTTTAKKTEKKTTTKSKKVKIMYSPVGFTAGSMSFPLKTKKYNGQNLVSVPLIEGLPMDLTLKKGESIEVTPEQLERLQAEKVVETQEEHERRIKFIENLPNQYPDSLSELEKAERKNALLTTWDSQNKIYNDKLIICD